MNSEQIINQAYDIVLNYGPNLVAAILVLIFGLWIVKIISNWIGNILAKRNVDPSLTPFLKSLINTLLKAMLAISVLGMLGVEMTSFVAILGAAGLAVGLALSGTLQNFAGGVMILIFRPFKAGDFIDAQGYSGTVSEIQIFNTILKTPDNKTIIIPNGGLSTSSMTNFSTEARRRVDWTFGIGYGDDSDKAKEVLRKFCDEDNRILKDPEVFIAMSELADSSVNFVVRAWVESGDYWAVHFDMIERVYKEFGNNGLNIPFPQMDVHVHKD